MATKRELAEEAAQLGQLLGVEVVTERKNHTQLTELVEELRAKAGVTAKPEGETGDPSGASSPRVETVTAEELETNFFGGAVLSQKQFRIAQGRSTNSRRGMLKEGAPVRASDFYGEEATLETLKRKGVIVPV